MIPASMFDRVAKNMVSYYPNPTSNALANNYTVAESNPARSDEFSVRVDHNISEKSRVFGRWSQKAPETTGINIGFW
jgi:hypothetical protein